MKKDLKKKKKSISQLKKQLDAIFSQYIRLRDKNICFTCYKQGNQAGHYISRRYNSLRYNEQNVNLQCVSCNIFRHGAMDRYAIELERKYGVGILQKLEQYKNFLKSFTREELEEKIAEYKNKIKHLTRVVNGGIL